MLGGAGSSDREVAGVVERPCLARQRHLRADEAKRGHDMLSTAACVAGGTGHRHALLKTATFTWCQEGQATRPSALAAQLERFGMTDDDHEAAVRKVGG